jgi:hypothetical protein
MTALLARAVESERAYVVSFLTSSYMEGHQWQPAAI